MNVKEMRDFLSQNIPQTARPPRKPNRVFDASNFKLHRPLVLLLNLSLNHLNHLRNHHR